MKQQILEAVAANLRDFGYPDAKASNVTTTRLFAMFGKRMVEEYQEKHERNTDVVAACDEILDEMNTAIGD